MVVVPDTKTQFAVVRRILKDRSIERVVCATDSGREGELIFRYVYEAASRGKWYFVNLNKRAKKKPH